MKGGGSCCFQLRAVRAGLKEWDCKYCRSRCESGEARLLWEVLFGSGNPEQQPRAATEMNRLFPENRTFGVFKAVYPQLPMWCIHFEREQDYRDVQG